MSFLLHSTCSIYIELFARKVTYGFEPFTGPLPLFSVLFSIDVHLLFEFADGAWKLIHLQFIVPLYLDR